MKQKLLLFNLEINQVIRNERVSTDLMFDEYDHNFLGQQN